LFSLVAAGLLILSSTGTFVAGGQEFAQAANASLVKTAPAQILTTGAGMTLYIFTKDKPGKSMCSGKCLAYWPAYTVPAGAKVPATMTGMAGTFGTIMATGGDQLTYDKSPLYTFAGDKKAGATNGQGVAGVWWTVVAGSGMSMAALPATSPVKLASTKILVTTTGMSLYVFNEDKPGSSACSGPCAKFWPPLTVPAGTMPAATMMGSKGKFGTITRADGSMQLTFDGAPLYTFAGDKKPGDLKGEGLAAKWWAVSV
jgi:predicted lipoprotein with Yx(FWY)xxD motif